MGFIFLFLVMWSWGSFSTLLCRMFILYKNFQEDSVYLKDVPKISLAKLIKVLNAVLGSWEVLSRLFDTFKGIKIIFISNVCLENIKKILQ